MKFEPRSHVFYSASRTINVSTHASSDISSARSAFKGMANTIRRRPSVSSLDNTLSPSTSLPVEKERTYPFSFVLPRSLRSGEELPPTFPLPSSQDSGGSSPSTSRAGSFSVEYKVLVSWDPIAAYEHPSLWVSDTNLPNLCADAFLLALRRLSSINLITTFTL